MNRAQQLELVKHTVAEVTLETTLTTEEAGIILDDFIRIDQLSNVTIVIGTTWFQKLPLRWRLCYYLLGGIGIGLLLPYCF